MVRFILSIALALALPLAAQAQPRLEPMIFRNTGHPGNYGDAEWIAADGRITPETPEVFAAFIAEHRGWGSQVVFNSNGGTLGAALELGRLIREHELRTAIGETYNPNFPGGLEEIYAYGLDAETQLIDGVCESACVFAFLGGVGRTVHNADVSNPRTGRLGIHRFFSASDRQIPSEAVQTMMGQLLFYLIEMEINPDLLRLMSEVPEESMRYLSAEETERYGIETRRSAAPPELELFGDGLAWTGTTLNEAGRTMQRTRFFCRDEDRKWVLRHIEVPMAKYPGMFFGSEHTPGDSVRTDFVSGRQIQANLYGIWFPSGEFRQLGGFELVFGTRLPEFAGEEIEQGRISNVSNDIYSFNNVQRRLPDPREFHVLSRTCVSPEASRPRPLDAPEETVIASPRAAEIAAILEAAGIVARGGQ